MPHIQNSKFLWFCVLLFFVLACFVCPSKVPSLCSAHHERHVGGSRSKKLQQGVVFPKKMHRRGAEVHPGAVAAARRNRELNLWAMLVRAAHQAHLLCPWTHWGAPELQKGHNRHNLNGIASLITRVAHNRHTQRAAQNRMVKKRNRNSTFLSCATHPSLFVHQARSSGLLYGAFCSAGSAFLGE